MERSKAPVSSIFSSRSWNVLNESYAEEKRRWTLFGIGLSAIWAAVAIAYAILSPNELFRGRFFVNSTIRVAREPASKPSPGLCETTQDGLYYYPSEVPAASSLLVLGDSSSNWDCFPQWIDRTSAAEGNRIAVYVASMSGDSLYEIEDKLTYILANNQRRFDVVLIKPGFLFMWNLLFDPRDKYTHPPIGSGFAQRYAGSPLGATRTSFLDHFLSVWERRKSNYYQFDYNRKRNRMYHHAKPGPDPVYSTVLPRAIREDLRLFEVEYRNGLRNLVTVARLHEVAIVFVTTAVKPYHPRDRIFHDPAIFLPAYKGKYIFALIQHHIARLTNDTLRSLCRDEDLPLIDSVRFVENQPRGNTFRDPFHLDYSLARPHGQFIYDQLKRWGI